MRAARTPGQRSTFELPGSAALRDALGPVRVAVVRLSAGLDPDEVDATRVDASTLAAVVGDVQPAIAADIETFTHAETEDRRRRHVEVRDACAVHPQLAFTAAPAERTVHELEAVFTVAGSKRIARRDASLAAVVHERETT